MSRPVKNYCDYFTHDRDMRNHRKIKAIRNKFGASGYAIWCMLLEYLTGIDGNEFENSDMEFELMAGDFGVSVTEIRDVVNYCLVLELLFEKDGFIHSESLDERLVPVYEKRKTNKSKSKKQLRNNGKFATNNSDSNGVSVTEIPQSKVKESKLPETKFLIPEMFSKFKEILPAYPGYIENDFEPLRKIAEFLMLQLKLNGDIVKNKDAIISEWGSLAVVVKNESFYTQKPLSVISKLIQEIYQIHKDGNAKNNRSGIKNGGGLSSTAIIQPDRKANTAL